MTASGLLAAAIGLAFSVRFTPESCHDWSARFVNCSFKEAKPCEFRRRPMRFEYAADLSDSQRVAEIAQR